MRVVLSCEHQKILLEEGETLIGRGLHCAIRFNDPAVSREHVRLIVTDGTLSIENLSRTNGTRVNDAPLRVAKRVSSGDIIQLGHRRLAVELVEEARRRPITLDPETERGSGLLVDEESVADEHTEPGDVPIEEPPRSDAIPRLIATELHHCPRCRTAISYFDDTCSCGYSWPSGLPGSTTQKIRISDRAGGRAGPRFSVEVPVIYASESLTFDATVRDLGRGGMFIATELLDPIGTECHITVLPDGHPAVPFAAVVVHVASHAATSGRPAGLGVKFTRSSPAGRRWLDEILTRATPAGG